MAKIISKSKIILLLIILVASFLRLWKISVNPVSLFGDELDLGYQAYSILQTGRDYQGNFMPLHFHSLAEWRTPLYLYASVPTVAIFGITPFGVRLPAAIFGILGILVMFLFVKEITKNENLGLISAAILATNPWHLQYSRAGFEVTLLLLLLLTGLWLFFKSLSSGKWLWLSVICFTLTPWVYSTAKLFTPLLMIFLGILYKKEILNLERKKIIYTIISGLVVGIPIAISTVFGGGAQRFSYISVFSDPTIEPEVGVVRQIDAQARGEKGVGLKPTILDRVIHNKFTFVGNVIIKNYLQPFSTEFLFIKGDPDPRQSVGIGEFYRIEIVPLLVGIVFFFTLFKDKRIKFLVLFWLTVGVIPAILTRDGGNHATRLILILPPIAFLISYGLYESFKQLPKRLKVVSSFAYLSILFLSFFLYLHEYYIHYPTSSERWWHYGWTPAVREIKSIDKDYDRVIISMTGEPAWIFFAANYQYPPALWQKEFPIGNDENVSGFGMISHTGKYYFGSPDSKVQIYGIGRYINSRTLYLANASEVGENLILHPDKTPPDLKIIKSIPYPSGEPAFYLFTGTKN